MSYPDTNYPKTAEITALLEAFRPERFRPMAHSRTVAIYGSLLYKPLTEVRDIDMFAIMSAESGATGRIEVMIPVNRVGCKRASIYLINEVDYLRDAVYGISGGRWAVLCYHGCICSDWRQYDYYHAWGLAGLSHQLDLPIKLAPVEFLRMSATIICSVYPMYAKSVIDYLQNPRMRKIAAYIHSRARTHALAYLSTLKRNVDRLPRRELKKRYLGTELGTRPLNSHSGIRPLHHKLALTLSIIREHEDLLTTYCGSSGYTAMIESYDETSDILDELEEEAAKYMGDACPLLGRYELQLA